MVDILHADAAYKQKLGSKLLKYVETKAAKKGAYMVLLTAFEFQAKDFYLKHGYEIFGIVQNCPPEYKQFHMQKLL